VWLSLQSEGPMHVKEKGNQVVYAVVVHACGCLLLWSAERLCAGNQRSCWLVLHCDCSQ
jgi:hypothetical protein